jgi:restriction endonuclease S subunit
MQNILKQNCSGTILTAINKVYFKRISIPLISVVVQRRIAGLVQKSFALRKKSEELLEEAKVAVEEEIEGGEKHG